MVTVCVDKLQSICTDWIFDHWYYQDFINWCPQFVTYGLVNLDTYPLHLSYNFFFFDSIKLSPSPLAPITIRELFQNDSVKKAVMFEAVWIYAMIDKREVKRNKGKSPSPCVNVCVSTNNWKILSLGKAKMEYKTPFHRLLTTEFTNKFILNPGDKVKPQGDCGITDCSRYKKRQSGNLTECCNTLGGCAEQRAANEILREGECNAHDIADLEFSWALRPRTMGIIPYCYNCRTIFPQLK